MKEFITDRVVVIHRSWRVIGFRFVQLNKKQICSLMLCREGNPVAASFVSILKSGSEKINNYISFHIIVLYLQYGDQFLQ
jgi:hypothetical protein